MRSEKNKYYQSMQFEAIDKSKVKPEDVKKAAAKQQYGYTVKKKSE